MGPPKRKIRKVAPSEQRRRYDYFEYRWDANSATYYLFNLYTGETIFSTNVHVIDRSQSMWAPIEKYPSDKVQFIQLLPEWYLSRRWGRRKFFGWNSKHDAAVHITAVARGFLARLHLRMYYKQRYYMMLDSNSGYYYFVDRVNPDGETTWHKPRLAFPDDIQAFTPDDPDDYLKGNRFYQQKYECGPLLKVTGLSKYDTGRAELTAFHNPDPIRDNALKKYEQIDLEQMNFSDLVAWLDSDKLVYMKFTEYHFMRTAICNNNWNQVIYYMKQYPNNFAVQLFGYFGFSKTFVPMDSTDIIDYDAREALDMCIEVVIDKHDKINNKLKLYAMRALFNLFSVRGTRVEYLNTERVQAGGVNKDEAIEEYLKTKLNIFNKYLINIPTEEIKVYQRGEKEPKKEYHPLPSALELIGAALQCLCLLAEEGESKEVLSMVVLDPLVFAMDICAEDPFIMLGGLKLMYNLCYRCETGQQAVLMCCNPKVFLERIAYNHSGDTDVMRQLRRVQLALEPDGWRGNVEAQITKEFYSHIQTQNYRDQKTEESEEDSKARFDRYMEQTAKKDEPADEKQVDNMNQNAIAESKYADDDGVIHVTDAKDSYDESQSYGGDNDAKEVPNLETSSLLTDELPDN